MIEKNESNIAVENRLKAKENIIDSLQHEVRKLNEKLKKAEEERDESLMQFE